MRFQRVLEFDLDLAAGKRTVPAVLAANADADREIIEMCNRSAELFAAGQGHRGQNRLLFRIEHVRFELDGVVFLCDTGKVARGLMALAAAAGALEKRLTFFRVSGKQLFKRIVGGNTGRLDGFPGAGVKKGCNVADLFRTQGQRRHALVRAPVTDHLADQIAFDVMGDQRRTDQVGATGAGSVGAVAETASLLELQASAINGGPFFGSRLRRTLRFRTETQRGKQQNGGQENGYLWHIQLTSLTQQSGFATSHPQRRPEAPRERSLDQYAFLLTIPRNTVSRMICRSKAML